MIDAYKSSRTALGPATPVATLVGEGTKIWFWLDPELEYLMTEAEPGCLSDADPIPLHRNEIASALERQIEELAEAGYTPKTLSATYRGVSVDFVDEDGRCRVVEILQYAEPDPPTVLWLHPTQGHFTPAIAVNEDNIAFEVAGHWHDYNMGLANRLKPDTMRAIKDFAREHGYRLSRTRGVGRIVVHERKIRIYN